MSTPPLSPDEQIVLAYFDNQPPAPESFRVRLARELMWYDGKPYYVEDADQRNDWGGYEELADRAIEVMLGDRPHDAVDRDLAEWNEQEARNRGER